MTWYQRIRPLQKLIDLGADMDSGRARVAFNVEIKKGPSETLLEELVKILDDADVGTLNTNIFCGSKAQVPAEGGPYLVLNETGGAPSEYIHNDRGPAYERPNVQVLCVSPKYKDARALLADAYEALSIISNRDVTP